MAIGNWRGTKPDSWVIPRPPCDASQRLQTYGKLHPMDDDEPAPRVWLVMMLCLAATVGIVWLLS